MHGTTVRTNGGHYTTINARHHTWHADSPEADGGTDNGPTPEELLLGAIGACAVITAKMYAARKGWPLEDVYITLDMARTPKEGAPYAHVVTEKIEIIGDLTEEQRLRIQEIMARCPVRRTVTSPLDFEEDLLQES